MSTRENDIILELTASELDIVTGGTKNLHLGDIAKAAAKAAARVPANVDGGTTDPTSLCFWMF